MTLEQLLQAYNQVATHHGLPTLQADHIDIDSSDLDQPDAVWQRLDAFAPDSGWLCFQSRVSDLLPGQPLPRPDANSGLLLSAECHNSRNGHSLQLRQNSHGGWRLTELRPGSGAACLSEAVQLVAHQPQQQSSNAPRRLHYQRYWTLDDHGPRQLAARFSGFQRPGEQP